jgi:hypothetical protein
MTWLLYYETWKTYSVVWIVLIIIAIVIMNVNFKRKHYNGSCLIIKKTVHS